MTQSPRPIAQTGPRPAQQGPLDRREQLVAGGIELSRRAQDSSSSEDLYFLLTNDARAMLEFERSFLITHLAGQSVVAAVGNLPMVEKKSAFYEHLTDLAAKLKELAKPLLLSN